MIELLKNIANVNGPSIVYFHIYRIFRTISRIFFRSLAGGATYTLERLMCEIIDVIGWMDKVRASLTTETIVSGFRKAGISATDYESAASSTSGVSGVV